MSITPFIFKSSRSDSISFLEFAGQSESLFRHSVIDPIPLLPYKSDFISPSNQIFARRVMGSVVIIGIIMLFLSFLAILGFCLQAGNGTTDLSFIQSIGLGISNLIKDTGLILPIVFSFGGSMLIFLGLFYMPKTPLNIV